MQIQVRKSEDDTIMFKYSHADETYEVLRIGESRRNSGHIRQEEPEPLYPLGYHKLSEAKYQDLQSLCKGPTPVVVHSDYQDFYSI